MKTIREIILLHTDAEERIALYKSETIRLRRTMLMTILLDIVIIGIALLLNFVLFNVCDAEETDYWLGVGIFVGMGIMAIGEGMTLCALKLSVFRPPTMDEMNRLGDKIR